MSPFANSYYCIYLSGYFYFAANFNFCATDSNFALVNPKYYSAGSYYRQICYYSSQLYVVAFPSSTLHVFDTHVNFIQSISLSYAPYGLSNGNFYLGLNAAQIVYLYVETVNVNICVGRMVQLTFDSFGYLVALCEANNKLVLYDYNLNYISTIPTTAGGATYVTGIDASGRFIVIISYSLDILESKILSIHFFN